MELTIDDGENKMKIEFVKLQKMILLFNALEDGWTIKKKNENYCIRESDSILESGRPESEYAGPLPTIESLE